MALDPYYTWSPERQERFNAEQTRRGKLRHEILDSDRKYHAERSMKEHDALPYKWRLVVHQYGMPQVRQLMRKHRSAERAMFSQLGANLDL